LKVPPGGAAADLDLVFGGKSGAGTDREAGQQKHNQAINRCLSHHFILFYLIIVPNPFLPRGFAAGKISPWFIDRAPEQIGGTSGPYRSADNFPCPGLYRFFSVPP
jgi:hypothetical protein